MLLFLAQLADIKKLLTHWIRPFTITGGLKTDMRNVYYHHATPPSNPMCWMK